MCLDERELEKSGLLGHKCFFERECSFSNGIEEGAFLFVNGDDGGVQLLKEEFFVLSCKREGIRGCKKPEDDLVCEGSVGLHKVGGQAEGVVLVMVMDADMRVQGHGAEISCEGRIDDGVNIVEEDICVFCQPVAPGEEIEYFPIDSGSLCLDIGDIASRDAFQEALK